MTLSHGGEGGREYVARKHEILEWLSLTAADLPVWLAGAAVVGMWFAKDPRLDWVLAAVALALSVIACFFGMKHDARVSLATNIAKKVVYPICVLMIVLVTYLNFSIWNG